MGLNWEVLCRCYSNCDATVAFATVSHIRSGPNGPRAVTFRFSDDCLCGVRFQGILIDPHVCCIFLSPFSVMDIHWIRNRRRPPACMNACLRVNRDNPRRNTIIPSSLAVIIEQSKCSVGRHLPSVYTLRCIVITCKALMILQYLTPYLQCYCLTVSAGTINLTDTVYAV